jgi:hypothetical protein
MTKNQNDINIAMLTENKMIEIYCWADYLFQTTERRYFRTAEYISIKSISLFTIITYT